MDTQLVTLESDMSNYNKVKDLILKKIVDEGYMSEEESEEFSDRCQVLIYKGTWFSKWFDKNVKTQSNDKNSYYIRVVEMKEKQSSLDDLIRRTANER